MEKDKRKGLIITLLIIQSIVFAILTSFYLDYKYKEDFSNIAKEYKEISLNNIEFDKNKAVGDYLERFLSEKNAIFLKQKDDYDYAGKKLMHVTYISGDYEGRKADLNLSFLNQKYASDQSFKKLKEDGGTIGLLNSDYEMIEKTPKFIMGDSYAFINLIGMGRLQGFNGKYKTIGLTDDDVKEFYEKISEITGKSIDDIKNQTGGMAAMGENIPFSFLAIYLVVSLVILAMLIIITVSKLEDMGVYLLQGWSKSEYIKSIYGPINKIAYILPILFIPYGFILCMGSFKTLKYYGIFLLAGLLNLLMFLIFEFLVSLILRTVKPIAAMHGRISKKGLLAFGIILYILVNVSTSFLSLMGIDKSVAELFNQIETKNSWEEVSDYYVNTTFNIGNDYMNPQNGETPTLDNDFIDFYKSIAGKDGVKTIHTEFYRGENYEMFKNANVYNYPPNFSFVEFKADKNYISEDMGIEITNEMTDFAKNGYRVYLIPKTFTKDQKEQLEKYFTEDDIKKNQEFADKDSYDFPKIKGAKFFTYENDREYFAFPTDIEDDRYEDKFPLKTNEAVISLITPENILYFEAKSLLGGGETNSTIKLNQKAYDKYINKDYYKKFNLDDNMPEFVKIKDLITGMIKSLAQSIGTFVLIAMLFSAMCILILLTLINLYREIYLEEVNIKKFLGYDNKKIYKPLWLVIIIASLINLSVALISQSIFGFILALIIGAMQIIFMIKLTKRDQFNLLVEFLK